MAVSTTAAYGLYPPSVALPEIVSTLNREGFVKEDICMVLSPDHPAAAAMREPSFPTARQDETARAIGWFSEFGAVVIPTVGFFIRSHAYFRALVQEQDFPTLSRDCRTLAGLGFCEDDARRLGRRLTDIGVLVYVSCGEGRKAEFVVELLRRTGASEAAKIKEREAKGASTAA